MLLVHLDDAQQGMQVGAAVMNPRAPDVVLLKPGVKLTSGIIQRLQRLAVQQLWVDHDLTKDLDTAVAPSLAKARIALYSQMRDDFNKLAQRTLTTVQLKTYREAMTTLVKEVCANADFVNLTDQLFDADNELVSHSGNVAYLSVLVGLELEGYLVRERNRLPAWRARNVVNLGLGGMLHDIGKVKLAAEESYRHEVLGAGGPDDDGPDYRQHPSLGYDMLPAQVPSVTRTTVLNHHQRYDGTGWSRPGKTPGTRGPAGHKIHVFTRIVAAANALDNLLRDADGTQRPPVAALHDFASTRFDGWFDPVIRLAVLRRTPPFAMGSQVILSDGREAVVTRPNVDHPCRPTVRLLNHKPSLLEATPAHINLENAELHIKTCAGVDVEQWLFEIDNRLLAHPGGFGRMSDVA